MIELTFINREGERKSLDRRIVFGPGGSHAGVGITLAAVVEPQLLPVLRDAIGIVDVAAGQEAQHVGGRRLDDGIELPLAENMIAGEVDLRTVVLAPSVME